MNLKFLPIELQQAPNYWSPSKNTFWEVTTGVAVDLWGMVQISDNLGVRPYVAAPGATLQAIFQRGDLIGVIPTGIPLTTTPNQLSVTKTLVFDAQNRSLARMQLTAQDATNVISGTIQFTLTEGTVVTKWNQNWAVRKLNTSAGF